MCGRSRTEHDVGHELLEHTADLGIRAWGPSLEAAFEQTAVAVLDLLDVRASGEGSPREVRLSAPDLEALLVAFVNDLVFLVETEDVAVADVGVRKVSDTDLEAELWLVGRERRPEGVVVKAATYHALRVERAPDRTELRVFLDV